MSFRPTGAWEYVKLPQFIEEVTYGVLPLTNPTFISCGLISDIDKTFNVENEQYRILGNRDIYSQVKLGEQYTFTLKYRPTDIVLMKYGTELVNATGTNEKSISILVSKKVDAVEKYRIYTGVKTASITVEITRAGGINITQNMKCKNITDWGSAPVWVGTPSFAATPTADPVTGISSGSNPLTIAGANYDTPRFSFTVDQGLQEIKPNGELTLKYLFATNRSVSVDFDTWIKDIVLQTAQANYTAQAVTYQISNTPNPVILATFSSVKFDNMAEQDTAGSTDFSMAKFSGSAKTVTVS
jgi:hypothetical protein